MVQGIDLHELQASRHENFLPGDMFAGLFDHAVCVRVTITVGITDDVAFFVKQRKVQTPRIHPNPHEIVFVFAGCLA
jgi:hypothetical protein